MSAGDVTGDLPMMDAIHGAVVTANHYRGCGRARDADADEPVRDRTWAGRQYCGALRRSPLE
jgi:hypothetical protein